MAGVALADVELSQVRSHSTAPTTDPPPSILQPADMAEAPPVRTKIRMAAILVALYLSLFIAALEGTILATAIPTITADLHSASGYFWIGAAYLLANAASAPVWAKVSDVWGRKPALLVAVVLFAGASLPAALAVNMKMLIAARAVQGTAGGGLIQLVNITVADLFSLRRRALHLGALECIWALAGGLGPILGGVFTQLADWRWCFWINLPVSVTTFILLFFFLDVHDPRTPLWAGLRAIDWPGTLSILAVTLMILLGLDFGGATYPWNSPIVICLIVFGALAIGLFYFSEKKLAKYPLMPLTMFNNRSNNAAFLVGFSHGACFIVAEYYLPLYFQSALTASPLRSGVLILPVTLSEAGTGIVTGILIHQTGRYRELTWIGMALLTIGTGLYILFDRTSSLGTIVTCELVGGIGAGFLFQAPLMAVQAVASQADTAMTIASFAFIRTLAMSISIVIGGVIFQNGMDNRSHLLRAVGLDEQLIKAFSHGDAAANVEKIKFISDVVQREAVQDAFAWSMRNMWIAYTVIAAVGLAGSVFMKHVDLRDEHTETRTGIDEMTKRDGAA